MTLWDLVDRHWAAGYALALFTVFWVPLALSRVTLVRVERSAPPEKKS